MNLPLEIKLMTIDYLPIKKRMQVLFGIKEKVQIDQTNENYYLEEAIKHENLPMLRYMIINNFEWTINSIDVASKYGNLGLLKYLHKARPKECSNRAIDYAAHNGNLEIVKWLLLNRNEGCTKRAMGYASEKNHLEVFKWLLLGMFESKENKVPDL
jgi:hypothetical protein